MRWILLLAAISAWAQPAPGRWDGNVLFGQLKVPFRLDLKGEGAAITGALINGETSVPATSGGFEAGRLRLGFGESGPKLEATLVEGALKGNIGAQTFTASPYCTCGMEGVAGPAIEGSWEIAELGWKLDVKRKGEDTLVMLSRAGERIGPLNGRYDGLAFQLHYFDGKRAAVLELEDRKDGGLDALFTEPGKEPVKGVASRDRSTGDRSAVRDR